jgi:hypothetical protein
VLLTGIAVVLALFAAAVGIAGRWRWSAVLAGVGAAAALSRPAGTWFYVVPPALAAAVAGGMLWSSLRCVPTAVSTGDSVSLDRRAFLRAAAIVAGGAIVGEGAAES